MVTARHIQRWADELESLIQWITPRFSRVDLQAQAGHYLHGLISRAQRKNNWQLAEELGHDSPTNLQHFIARARWNADEIRDDLREYVDEQLGDDDAVLIIDETGFLKKGTHSVGVKRQYSGTAGRIENCQIGVFLAYRSVHGHALIDRALYLPKEWAEDDARRTKAKVPEDVSFATKPELARQMIRRATDAGVRCRWVAADEVYGGDSKFRQLLEEQGLSYVVAVARDQRLWSVEDFQQHRVEAYADAFSEDQWQELSCGSGTKGERVYRWALMQFGASKEEEQGTTYQRGLLVREHCETRERAYYLSYAPVEVALPKLVEVAGSRWAIEECFKQAKQETGLDEYEVRSWLGWHRHITLSMLAFASLVVIRHQANTAPQKRTKSRSSS